MSKMTAGLARVFGQTFQLLRKEKHFSRPHRDGAHLAEEFARLEQSERRDFFRRAFFALFFNQISGDYAEFGCWTGTTFTLAYEESRHAEAVIASWGGSVRPACGLWAFDSFSGLPAPRFHEDEHPRWVPGALKTSLEEFHTLLAARDVPRSAYQVVPGFFEETLAKPTSDASLPRDIALAYVDCDLYSSTLTVLQFLLPRLKHGMIIAFDDYYCCSSNQLSGERRAQLEIFDENPEWTLIPYLQFGWHGMSFLVESRRLAPRASETNR